MKDERDHRGTDAVENRCDLAQAPQMHIEGAKTRDDQEVRKNKGPAAGPRTPEPAAQIRDEDSDLDRERARERLAHGDGFPHLLLSEPAPSADELAFHLADERDGSSEP